MSVDGGAGAYAGGRGVAMTSLARRSAARIGRFFLDPGQVLGLVLLAALVARAIWLTLPDHSLIFDETYYVNAARVILGWHVPAGSPYAGSPPGLDPNSEHPPLGKALIALSMLIFGDNGLGWRLPSVIAGMVALLALYGIVRAAGEGAWLGVLATALFAFDNLVLVHSRIGTLDILFLAPVLVGAWLALRERWVAAGVALAIGSLMKLTAAFGLGAVVALQLIEVLVAWRRARRVDLTDLRPLAVLLSAFAVVAIGGLWLLDLRFSTYHNPWDHLQHMVSYGTGLTNGGSPSGIASDPWQWLVNQVQINYLQVDVNTLVNGKVVASHPSIAFIGALNPVLLAALPLAAPFALWLALRQGSRLALWSIVWGGVNYLPYYPLALLDHRIVYLYYMLPFVPALAVAVALLLLRARLPGVVAWGYLAAFALAFAAYFPFRQIP